MLYGEINYAKSNFNEAPCPLYAVQGQAGSGLPLRVIFAQCATKTNVVTCQSLEKEPDCPCLENDK